MVNLTQKEIKEIYQFGIDIYKEAKNIPESEIFNFIDSIKKPYFQNLYRLHALSSWLLSVVPRHPYPYRYSEEELETFYRRRKLVQDMFEHLCEVVEMKYDVQTNKFIENMDNEYEFAILDYKLYAEYLKDFKESNENPS